MDHLLDIIAVVAEEAAVVMAMTAGRYSHASNVNHLVSYRSFVDLQGRQDEWEDLKL